MMSGSGTLVKYLDNAQELRERYYYLMEPYFANQPVLFEFFYKELRDICARSRLCNLEPFFPELLRAMTGDRTNQ